MSELKAFRIIQGDTGGCGAPSYKCDTDGNQIEEWLDTCEVYDKSEADKVIDFWKNESHKHYENWFNLNKQFEGWFGKVMRCERAERELRRQKYKRCLAMAKECEVTALWCYQAANTLPTGFHATLFGKPVMIEPDRLFNRFELLMKWSNRWMKIAELFKDKEA